MKQIQQSIIIIDGPMGSGKTTIGNLVHKQLKRTALIGTDRIKWFVSDFERTPEDNAIAASVLMAMCREYITQGISVLLAQGFWKQEYVQPYIELGKQAGIPVFVYQLSAPREMLLARIRERPVPPLATSPVPMERILKNLETWEKNRYDARKVFDTSIMQPEEVASGILKDLI